MRRLNCGTSKLEMTGWYVREIPESVRTAVAEMNTECGAPGKIRTYGLLLRRLMLPVLALYF